MLLVRGAPGRLARGCALAALATVACGTFQRHHERHAASEETQQTRWEGKRTEERTAATAASTSKAVLTSRRVVTRKPDGTVIDDQLVQRVVDLATLQFREAGSSSGSATGASEAAAKKRSDEKGGTEVDTSWPWWVWPLGALVIVAAVWFAWRRVTRARRLASG